MTATPISDSRAAETRVPLDRGASQRLSWCEGGIVFLAGLAVRLWLIHSFPVIFGGDSIVRLANKDRILLSYQLPLLQAVVHFLSTVSGDPLLVRYFMAVVGAAAGLAFFALASTLLRRTTGFQTSLLFVTSPFVLAFSIVPYQEIVMLAGLFAAFYFAFEDRWGWAGLLLGIACWTRYEVWLACPVLGLGFLLRRGLGREVGQTGLSVPRGLAVLKALALFGWAPLAWILFQGGITPAGTFAAESSFSFERLFRFVYLGWITVKNTPLPVLALALLGAWVFWKRRLPGDWRYRLLLAFLALFLAGVLLSAHGERDQPERFVTAREAHVLLAGVVLVAGIGLERIPRFRWWLVGLCVAAGLWMAHRFVANEAGQPAFALSYQAAEFLDAHVGPGEEVVVLSAPVPREYLARYLDKAEAAGGSEGRREAVSVLLGMDTSPPNYQRILVHSRLSKTRLRSLASLPADLVPPDEAHSTALDGLPDWLLVWSDFRGGNAVEEILAAEAQGREPVRTFRQGPLAVAVYRLL